jgi:hypothetical protein
MVMDSLQIGALALVGGAFIVGAAAYESALSIRARFKYLRGSALGLGVFGVSGFFDSLPILLVHVGVKSLWVDGH